MKLEELIRCIGINPFYVNSESQREQLKKLNEGIDLYRGGIANAYVYIPLIDELDNRLFNNDNNLNIFQSNCRVHGDITFCVIAKGIDKYHCPYSGIISDDKYNDIYIILGWDTNHYDDTPESWTYQSIIKENEQFAKQILDVINKELGV